MTEESATSDVLSVIVGPTAAGKSAIAMDLAEHFGLAIVSADSRQIYRGFDIGTAKPTHDEMVRVPHFGIDVCDPATRYSAHQWAADVEGWLHEIRQSSRRPLVVGGTGFYVRALVEPLDRVPSLDPGAREQLAAVLDTLSPDELERWCRRLDPARAALGRTQRLRAVETALLTGTRLSETYHAPDRARRRARYLVVDPGPLLARRIEARVVAMEAAGWPDEVRALIESVPADAPAWQASGYARMRDAVMGTMTRSAALERIVIETRQYAKRQRTWFRHQLPAESVTVLDSSAPDARDRARAWWASNAASVEASEVERLT